MYKIVIKKSATKEMNNITDPDFSKIAKTILSLNEKPYPYPQSKRLKGEDKYRLRVGNYRIVYTIDEKQRLITIFKVCHRKDVYR
ncbi:MAG: type II toxin-antitoxin system RelE/ParE family toxin [Nitrospirae bacterium]|nr:type II toxin-antitoxin system RelE/ParE family toxin [Nitrospirota bacterium]MBF0540712.1 type II toxin-antitoxin system RelE/ParE family toxin [Nitrospirota bacterium]